MGSVSFQIFRVAPINRRSRDSSNAGPFTVPRIAQQITGICICRSANAPSSSTVPPNPDLFLLHRSVIRCRSPSLITVTGFLLILIMASDLVCPHVRLHTLNGRSLKSCFAPFHHPVRHSCGASHPLLLQANYITLLVPSSTLPFPLSSSCPLYHIPRRPSAWCLRPLPSEQKACTTASPRLSFPPSPYPTVLPV